MIDPTLTISLGRSGLAVPAADLLFAGTRGATDFGIVGYQSPALQRRIGYAPDSPYIDGSEAISASWQQALMRFDWFFDNPTATETDVRAAYDEVVEAIGQFSFTVTTAVNGAPGQLWRADSGSIVEPERTYQNLANQNPVYTVTIPVYPIPGSP